MWTQLKRLWNSFLYLFGLSKKTASKGLLIGYQVVEEVRTSRKLYIPHIRRPEHVALLGVTGSGKTTLLKSMIAQDIQQSNGFFAIDLHGDITPAILSVVAHEEQKLKQDLSSRLVVINPLDHDYSVCLNLLDSRPDNIALAVTETVALLKSFWHLEYFGPRTEELLRNAVWVLSENKLTLVDLAEFLTNAGFRTSLVLKCKNPEVRQFFEQRFNTHSRAMQTVMREAILNKVTAFSMDPHIRHLVGNPESSFNFLDALDQGLWVIASLNIGRLGGSAQLLAGLLLTKIRTSVFARRNSKLFTIYADEVQNLLSSESGLESLLAEARKFNTSLCISHQHLGQLTTRMRTAIDSIGSHIYFRLSPMDAKGVASSLSLPKQYQETLSNFPVGSALLKQGNNEAKAVEGLPFRRPLTNPSDLLFRSRQIWSKPRELIEAGITARHSKDLINKEPLNEWD